MRRLLIITALLASVGFTTPASAVVSGNALLKSCEAQEGSEDRGTCKGFIMGVVDLGDEDLFCIPAGRGVTYRQIHDIVMKTLRDIPTIRNEPATDIISAVLMSTYPCAQKKSTPLL